jgi:predicted oxidoreductase
MTHIERQSPAPARSTRFDEAFDIVVVGAGAAGLASALFSRWLGNSVVVLEKAPEAGGTSKKAAFWYWVPNNEPMRALGIEDRREDCLRFMARLSRPEAYDANHPRFGMTDWEYESFAAIYDNASAASELLARNKALEYRHCGFVPDYWAELPENKAPTGRVLLPKDANETMSNGGEVAIRTMLEATRRDGVEVRTAHRVQRVALNDVGAVVGVVATRADCVTTSLKARKAVIFATGGFTHNAEMRKYYQSAPVFGGCAAATSEGDFVHIGSAVGADLRNMGNAWMCPILLEKALNHDPSLVGTFSASGDSMIFVDKTGRRVTNEKRAYNESAQVFFNWDPVKAEYPNLVLVAVWDQRSQKHSAGDAYGHFIVPPGSNDAHVISGSTLDDLAAAIRARLARYSSALGGIVLADDFADNLKASITRFNGFAVAGKDLDFHRGERQVELFFNGAAAPEPKAPNPTMYPFDSEGPYYAALLTGGNLDTKGGPATDARARVLDRMGQPIPGLYGAGNCVASASARAYWAGGATLGPFLAFAYLAANTAHEEPVK